MQGGEFHQAVRSESAVQIKDASYECCGREERKTDTDILRDPDYIHNDKQDEDSQQSCCEYHQILCFQTLEFHLTIDPFINTELHSWLCENVS